MLGDYKIMWMENVDSNFQYRNILDIVDLDLQK